MNKKQILLGILIVMVMAVCGAFISNVPSVFAAETTGDNIIETENEAGTFYGQGWYVVGETATLIAEMNDGYEFKAWVSVDDAGNTIAELSTDLEYTFVVENNIKIEAKWKKKAYTVQFADGLLDDSTGELKDFSSTIVNSNDIDGKYYHGDELTITLTKNADRYIYDLAKRNIYINDIAASNLSQASTNITNNEKGFNTLNITLNIRENITINLDYIYMYNFQIASGNDVAISEVIQFVTVGEGDYYSQIDSFNYLVRADKEINIAVAQGNDIYTFIRHKYQNQEYSNESKQSFRLTTDSVFVVEYNKKSYNISFNSYIINAYGELDLLSTPLYTINPVKLTAGDSIAIEYASETKIITIDTDEYAYATDIYGYKFVKFAINGEELNSNSYTLSETEPTNVEIQIIFDYIEYALDLQLVDTYFGDDVQFGYNYINCNKLVKGSTVKLFATSTKHSIKGWSLQANPTDQDYLQSDQFVFEPTGDAEQDLTYTIYLDVDYKYYSVEYKLSDNNIEPGATAGEYIYYGQLWAGIVEGITLSSDGSQATISLNGTTYANGVTSPNQTIQSVTSTMTYDDEKGAYKIDNFQYDIYLYINAETLEYSHIVLRDITYYYDTASDEFVLNHSNVTQPKDVQYSSVKNSRYSIIFDNLLYDTLIVYQTNSTDTNNYAFISFKDKTGNNVRSFDYSSAKRCILNSTSFDQVIAEYRKLANDINLNITNENAYSYDNIKFSVAGGSVSSGNVIVATNGEEIVINIINENITSGYKFDGYYLNGELLTIDSQLQIVMSNTYINQTIDISFIEIEYTINVYYIDSASNVIEQSNANGLVHLDGQDVALTSLKVVISGEYNIVATASNGHYVALAYMGSNAYELTGLIGNNASTAIDTMWKLSPINFQEAVINNASIDTNEVNLYIHFTKHTYSVKVYFEIEQNASSITYPSMYMNNIKQPVTRAQEEIDGVSTTKYFAKADGFEYGTNIELNLGNFMTGITLEKWQDANGNKLSTLLKHTISNIDENIVLTAVLQYINYSIEYSIVDESNNPCKYGRVISASGSAKMFDIITYSAEPNMGYVLKDKYAYNASNEKINSNIDSGFVFNPANFKIEDGYKINIYLVFGLKTIELNISNVVDGGLYHFAGQDVSSLATYTIQRKRGEDVTTLTNETGYEILTNDVVVMNIYLSSIGIDLNHIKLGNTTITTANELPYKLTSINIYEDEKVVGVYYKFEVEFAPSVIDGLDKTTNLQNVLKVRTYNLTYTYNFINSNFGITLIRKYNNSTAYGDEDAEIYISDVGFGSVVTFSYVYEGMNTEIGNKFKINGFSIAGIRQEGVESYTLQDVDLWEQVALAKYLEGSREISVVLMMSPKITLTNETAYSQDSGYVYEHQYIGQSQGLTTSGENPDVIVGGNFEVVIKYSTPTGFSDSQPINVGEYQVKIIAKITSPTLQSIDVEFEENVVYRITPASLTIDLKTYSSTSPLTKIYDGSSGLSSLIVTNDLVLNGLFEIDEDKVFIDGTRLSAQMSGTSVNTMEALYDVSVFDIYLLDKSNNTLANYVLSSGQNLVFTRIGKINPKPLHITGFTVRDKVYDDTNDVIVNVDQIVYEGKLETDSTQIVTENLKFYLENNTIGRDREVFIDWTDAMVGADSINYSITYEPKYIDIYPYELMYNVEGYGTFKVVDVDRLCLIPIESELIVRAYEKGSSEYSQLYTRVETDLTQREKLKICYDVVLRIGVVNQLVPQGLYIYLPKIKNTTKVIQLISDTQKADADISSQKGYTVVKVDKGTGEFAVITSKVYLPLWLIILIVLLVLLVIGLIVVTFIAIRRRTKNKYSAYDKI